MAKITHYDVGDIWQPQASFTVSGTPTDPTNITAKVKNPAGTITTYGPYSGATGGANVTRVSAGIYKLAVSLDTSGYWFARFEGTGTAAATEDQEAVADPSEFVSDSGLSTRALVGVAEMKDWLQQQNIATDSDLELVQIINDVSDRIHYEAEREFKPIGTNPQVRVLPVESMGVSSPWYVDGVYMGQSGAGSRMFRVGDLASYTQVQIISQSDWSSVLETVALGSITAHPTVRAAWEPVRKLEFQTTVTGLEPGMRLSITGSWGFPAVPGNIKQAVKDSVASIMDRDVEHYRQDLGTVSSEGGNVIMVGMGSQRMLTLPPAALAAAWSYRELQLA